MYVLCYLCRTIALVATVICWLYPTLNKFYLILSYLMSYESPCIKVSYESPCIKSLRHNNAILQHQSRIALAQSFVCLMAISHLKLRQYHLGINVFGKYVVSNSPWLRRNRCDWSSRWWVQWINRTLCRLNYQPWEYIIYTYDAFILFWFRITSRQFFVINSNFQTQINDSCHQYFLWHCHLVNAITLHWR